MQVTKLDTLNVPTYFSFVSLFSPKDPLRSNSPVAMETSIETADPLGVNAPMQQESKNRLLPFMLYMLTHRAVRINPPCSPDTDPWLSNDTTGKEGATPEPEEEPVSDRITETVTNGSMKETVSLTVDAKTETAVFKR